MPYAERYVLDSLALLNGCRLAQCLDHAGRVAQSLHAMGQLPQGVHAPKLALPFFISDGACFKAGVARYAGPRRLILGKQFYELPSGPPLDSSLITSWPAVWKELLCACFTAWEQLERLRPAASQAPGPSAGQGSGSAGQAGQGPAGQGRGPGQGRGGDAARDTVSLEIPNLSFGGLVLDI